MPARKPRKRKSTLVVPEVRQVSAPHAEATDYRFHRERFEDGSERPVRNSTQEQRERDQAFADFFGAQPILSPKANIRTMDSLLAEIAGQIHLAETEYAPELLAQAWAKAAGAFLAARAELVSIAKGYATIRTSHPAVRFELQRLRPQIVRALNGVLGDGSVRSVKVLHG